MKVALLRLFLPLVVVGVPMLASLAPLACGGRVSACSELGAGWTSCDGVDAGPIVANVCVLASEKRVACSKAAGTTTTSPTTPGTADGGAKCSAFTPDVCNGKCVDLRSDETHCGICDNPCSTGETCLSGTCK